MATDEGAEGDIAALALQKHSCVLCQQRKVKCDRTVSLPRTERGE